MDLISLFLPKDPNWTWTAPVLNEHQKGREESPSRSAPSENQKQKSSNNCRQRGKCNVGSRSRASLSKKSRPGKNVKKVVIKKTKSKALSHHQKNRASVKSPPTKIGKTASRSRSHRRRGKRNVGGGKPAVSAKPTATAKSAYTKHEGTKKVSEMALSQKKVPKAKTTCNGQSKSSITAQAKSNKTFYAAGYDGVISMEID